MAAIHLVAGSSATADRLQVRAEQDKQQGTELVPQLTTLLVVAPVQSQHRRPYLPGSVFIKEL